MTSKSTPPGFADIMDAFFGPRPDPPRLDIGEGRFRVQYVSEADLRGQLASLARMCGWFAEEEVVVPGWGRIDIVLREERSSTPRLIELKLDLTRASQVRRGFQQADGYGRWWTKEKSEAAQAHLVAAKHSEEHVKSIGDAYPAVAFLPVSYFITSLWVWGNPKARRLRAEQQLAEMQRWTAMQARALELLNGAGEAEE